MSQRLKELRKRLHKEIPAESQALAAKLETENRAPTAEELTQIDGLRTEKATITEEVTRLEAQIELRAMALGSPPGAPAAGPGLVEIHDLRPDKPFAHFGEFAMAVHQASLPGQTMDERLRPLAAITGMGQTVPADGGFMLSPAFRQGIWDRIQQSSDNLLSRVDSYTVDPGADSLTFTAIDESSRADGYRWGGVRGYWKAEADQMTGTKPKTRQLRLEPQELYVLVYVTDKLLRNSPIAVGEFLTRAGADEINFKIGDSIINGTGVGKPLGILNSKCLVSISGETGQDAATIVTENISKMWSRRLGANFVWLYNQEVEPQLDLLNVGLGTAGQLVYMPPQGIAVAPYGTIKGRPLIPSEYCAALGTVGDLILADFSLYAAGVRRDGLLQAMSIHLRFDYAESVFRFIFEIDGQPWLNTAVTPYKGTSGLKRSPFIALATRA